MDNVKTDSYYAEKAIGEIDAIAKYTEKARFYDDFVSDSVLVDAVLFRLIQLIEYLKTSQTSLKRTIARSLGARLLVLGTVWSMTMGTPIIE